MKRFRQPLKLLALGVVALVAIALLVNVVITARAKSRLERAIAALRDAGQPVALIDLAHKPPPPDENAATYLRRAKESLDAIDAEVGAAYDNESEENQTAIDLDQPTPAYLKAIRSALDAYPKTLELVNQAAACPSYDAQLDYSANTADFIEALTTQFQVNRAAIRLLSYLCTLQIADGQYDAAVDTGIAMLRLCRHFDTDPTILGVLVSIACRGVTLARVDMALRTGDLSDAARDRLDAEIKRADVVGVYKKSLESDRAFGLATLAEMAAGKHRETAGNLKFMWHTPAGFRQDQSGYLDYMALSIALVDRPHSEIKNNPAIEQTLKSAGALSEAIAPATQAAHVAVCRALIFLRSVQILNAIQRYEKQHPGREPSVAQLGLPAAITTDPFNGEPLHVVKKPAGWLIYGVDMNLKDDCGNVTPPIDCGFGPLSRVRHD